MEREKSVQFTEDAASRWNGFEDLCGVIVRGGKQSDEMERYYMTGGGRHT